MELNDISKALINQNIQHFGLICYVCSFKDECPLKIPNSPIVLLDSVQDNGTMIFRGVCCSPKVK